MALSAAKNEYSYDTQFARERILDAETPNSSATPDTAARNPTTSAAARDFVSHNSDVERAFPSSDYVASDGSTIERTMRRRPSQRLRHSQKRAASGRPTSQNRLGVTRAASRLSADARHLDSTFKPRESRAVSTPLATPSQAVPRGLRRPHRAFRLSLATGVVGALLFSQFLAALWLKSLVFSAAHRNDALVQKIAATEAAIDKAQRQITILGTDPKLNDWATKMGYRPAQQTDLDNVPPGRAAATESSNGANVDAKANVNANVDANNSHIEYSNGSVVASGAADSGAADSASDTMEQAQTGQVQKGGR